MELAIYDAKSELERHSLGFVEILFFLRYESSSKAFRIFWLINSQFYLIHKVAIAPTLLPSNLTDRKFTIRLSKKCVELTVPFSFPILCSITKFSLFLAHRTRNISTSNKSFLLTKQVLPTGVKTLGKSFQYSLRIDSIRDTYCLAPKSSLSCNGTKPIDESLFRIEVQYRNIAPLI